jgi:hypothetical protein
MIDFEPVEYWEFWNWQSFFTQEELEEFYELDL